LQQSMLSPSAEVFGTDRNVTDGSHPIISLEIKSHKIDHARPKTKMIKASESAYRTNELRSIMLSCLCLMFFKH
ncbi:hypothetical protein HID58_055200, partial [Brassica napus]